MGSSAVYGGEDVTLLAVVQFPIVVWIGPTVVAQAILALAAIAFTVYGVSFGQAIRA